MITHLDLLTIFVTRQLGLYNIWDTHLNNIYHHNGRLVWWYIVYICVQCTCINQCTWIRQYVCSRRVSMLYIGKYLLYSYVIFSQDRWIIVLCFCQINNTNQIYEISVCFVFVILLRHNMPVPTYTQSCGHYNIMSMCND